LYSMFVAIGMAKHQYGILTAMRSEQ